MATFPGEHPNERLGIVVDTPPREDAENQPPADQGASPSDYKLVRCTNKSTGDFLGFLATSGNNVYLEKDEKSENVANCKWLADDDRLYLCKETSPANRYLGLGWESYACWGITGGWNDPVLFNDDKTISLKSAPERKLYGPYKDYWVCWSQSSNNANIMTFQLV